MKPSLASLLETADLDSLTLAVAGRIHRRLSTEPRGTTDPPGVAEGAGALDRAPSVRTRNAEPSLLLARGKAGKPPSAPSERWSLAPPSLPVYRCEMCGATYLHPDRCCGLRVRKEPAGYFVPHRSAGSRNEPTFSVVVLSRNSLAHTRATVESFRRVSAGHLIEFVIVDGCSTDGSLNYFRDLARRETVQVVITPPEEPFLHARNCNRGAAAARGECLLFPPAGVELCDSDLLSKLEEALRDPRVGIAGIRANARLEEAPQYGPPLPPGCARVIRPLTGSLWGIRSSLFGELGGLDEGYRNLHSDEIEFHYRVVLGNYWITAVDSSLRSAPPVPPLTALPLGIVEDLERFRSKYCYPLFEEREWFAPFLDHVYPIISVAIACRNQGRSLPRALESVLGSYLHSGLGLQVVLVDDASSDETAAVLAEYRRRFPEQVSTIRRAVSRGPAPAKNDALDRCIGKYVALLDADDEFLPYKLCRCLEVLEETAVDFVYHDFLFVLPDGYHNRYHRGPWSLKRWREGSILPTITWAFRNGVVRFCEQYGNAEDVEFLRRRWRGMKTAYLPEALSRYYVTPGSLSSRVAGRVITEQLKGSSSVEVAGCSDL